MRKPAMINISFQAQWLLSHEKYLQIGISLLISKISIHSIIVDSSTGYTDWQKSKKE